MKLVLVLTLVVASCHAQDFVFPDQVVGLTDMQNNQSPPVSKVEQKINQKEDSTDSTSEQELATEVPELSTTLSPITTSPSDRVSFLPERWKNHVINIISRGITKFTLDMDRAIQNTTLGTGENLLFSPVSLSLTLAMVMLASGGKTFEEVSSILGLESGIDISHHSEIVHQILGLLLDESKKYQKQDENAPQANIAFGIFVEDGFPVREQFRVVSEEVYQSQIISVDFSGNSKKAQDTINEWVARKTLGKITNLLQQPPNPSTEVLITSALYFNGEWEQYFIEGVTRRKPFTISADKTVYVDLMANGGFFPFLEDKELGLKIIGFPYKANQVTMYAVMPTRGKGAAPLNELKSQLTPDVIENLIANMKNSSCIIGFPKMKLSSNLKLRRALGALGLKSLFDPLTADLSVLSPGRNTNEAIRPTNKPETDSTTKAQTDATTNETVPSRTPGSPGLSSGGFLPTPKNVGYLNNESNSRKARQSRPIDQEFLDFLESQNFTNFGVDDLRNTADLSNPGLYADEVLHKVEMTINEKGTEAAAVTSTSFDRSNGAKRFIANRPFLFFIRHDVGRVIWFWGTINKPTPSYDSA